MWIIIYPETGFHQALSVPDEFHSRFENVAILVEDWPSQHQITKTGLGRGRTLLGLCEGVSLTRRGVHSKAN